MKEIKRLLLILFISVFIFPHMVHASTSLSSSSQTPVVGSLIYVQIAIEYGTDLLIQETHLDISYDQKYLELDEVIWTQSRGTYTTSDNHIYLDKSPDSAGWVSAGPVVLKFKVIADGRSKISVDEHGVSYYEDGSPIAQSFSGVTINAVKANDNSEIGSLFVKGYTIFPTFNKQIHDYTLEVASDVTEVEVVATKGNSKQTIKGNGVRKLDYGDNRVRIEIIAEDGSSSTYEIMINRKDSRNGDLSLKNLYVSNTNITFEPGVYEYSAVVSKSVENVLISARPGDDYAELIGTGKKDLDIGLNVFKLVVKSNNDKEQIYTINITRSERELQTNVESNRLISLRFNDEPVDLKDEKRLYIAGTKNNESQLNIEAIPESLSAKVEITGNESLKPGFNIVTIKVIEVNNQSTEYKVVVYKKPDNANYIENLDEIYLIKNSDLIYNVKGDNFLLEKEIIEKVKESNHKLYINNINDCYGLIYQVVIDNKVKLEDINISFVRDNNSLNFKSELPEDIEMTLYAGAEYPNNFSFRLYTYDEVGQYNLLTDGTTIQNGYLNFKTNNQKNYVFTTQELIRHESAFNTFVNKYKKYALYVLGIGVLLILIKVITYNIKKAKESKEPLY